MVTEAPRQVRFVTCDMGTNGCVHCARRRDRRRYPKQQVALRTAWVRMIASTAPGAGILDSVLAWLLGIGDCYLVIVVGLGVDRMTAIVYLRIPPTEAALDTTVHTVYEWSYWKVQ